MANGRGRYREYEDERGRRQAGDFGELGGPRQTRGRDYPQTGDRMGGRRHGGWTGEVDYGPGEYRGESWAGPRSNADYRDEETDRRTRRGWDGGGFGDRGSYREEQGYWGAGDDVIGSGGYPRGGEAPGTGAWGGGYGDRERRLSSGQPYGGSRRGWEEGGRDFWDKASDEVASWFGDDDAERRREMDRHRGRGPRNYARSDDRIREDVNDRLTDDGFVDATDIEVSVSEREVTLDGTVDSRMAKRRAEDIADSVSGVLHVQNNLRVRATGRDDAATAGAAAARPATSRARKTSGI